MLFKCMLAMKNVSKNLKSVEDKIMGVQELCLFTEPSLKNNFITIK